MITFIKRLFKIFKHKPYPQPENWNETILDLYPSECPLAAVISETMSEDEDDPLFGWWTETKPVKEKHPASDKPLTKISDKTRKSAPCQKEIRSGLRK